MSIEIINDDRKVIMSNCCRPEESNPAGFTSPVFKDDNAVKIEGIKQKTNQTNSHEDFLNVNLLS
ncbi:CLUMA_CG001122, isoform A [Clunio marinus]|uniref:CLUMA_CG001122, isoform A n=1 Tax=Clunio marinus TaxID=568069 RepID=A0A1J1HH22_9DIPT|nr:CLUMA_CG001122, isoform A [Clunio marinus]